MSTHATSEGTRRYAERHGGAPGHFTTFEGLEISSIGFGTYLGSTDDSTDRAYETAIERALSNGCNVFDTAANYRCQRSERTIGAVLGRLFAAGEITRDQVVISTKGGFLPFDGSRPGDINDYFSRHFFEPGLIGPGELVAGCHCLAPRYLASQIDQSRKNLGLDTIDIYLLHNPEMQLDEVGREEFEERLLHAFTLLEERVSRGEIRFYGTATWDGYRTGPQSRHHLDLSRIVAVAEEAAGSEHHFRVVQLPYNLAMPEALVYMNQRVDDEDVTPLEAAKHHDIFVMASASIMQGSLSKQLPEEIRVALPSLDTDGQRALEFARSTPGIGTALVGMKKIEHVDENLTLLKLPRMSTETFLAQFTATP
jgi:aryl-alcohol dehydrogenase-like predicted oxidoreductase